MFSRRLKLTEEKMCGTSDAKVALKMILATSNNEDQQMKIEAHAIYSCIPHLCKAWNAQPQPDGNSGDSKIMCIDS